MKTSELVVGVFLGHLSLAEAINLNQKKMSGPDWLWDKDFNDTWKYTGRPHIMNETEYKDDTPKGFSEIQIPDYYANGYSDTWPWVAHPHIMTDPDAYKEDDPAGYKVALMQRRQR